MIIKTNPDCGCFREEEDKDLAAAIQASQAARRQVERGQVHERGGQRPRKEETVEGDELRGNRGAVKPPSDVQGKVGINFIVVALIILICLCDPY